MQGPNEHRDLEAATAVLEREIALVSQRILTVISRRRVEKQAREQAEAWRAWVGAAIHDQHGIISDPPTSLHLVSLDSSLHSPSRILSHKA